MCVRYHIRTILCRFSTIIIAYGSASTHARTHVRAHRSGHTYMETNAK